MCVSALVGGGGFFTRPEAEGGAEGAVAEAVRRHHRQVVDAAALQRHAAGRVRGAAHHRGAPQLRAGVKVVLQAALAGRPGHHRLVGLTLVLHGQLGGLARH